MQPIHYISKENIDQLYRQEYGPVEDVSVTDTDEKRGRFGISAGLSKLLAVASGTKISGNAEVEVATQRSETRTHQSNRDSRVVSLSRELLDEGLPPVSDITTENHGGLYTFTGPVRLENEADEGEVSIKVTYETEGRIITGLTSEKNWTSRSLVNNFLLDSVDDETENPNVVGVFEPISVSRTEDGRIKTIGQHLLIAAPETISTNDD